MVTPFPAARIGRDRWVSCRARSSCFAPSMIQIPRFSTALCGVALSSILACAPAPSADAPPAQNSSSEDPPTDEARRIHEEPGDQAPGAEGADCGGMTGLSCEAGLFCNYPIEASCGAADGTGKCTQIPEACTMEMAPVCGCDDKTHSNACHAHSEGVSVMKEGECGG